MCLNLGTTRKSSVPTKSDTKRIFLCAINLPVLQIFLLVITHRTSLDSDRYHITTERERERKSFFLKYFRTHFPLYSFPLHNIFKRFSGHANTFVQATARSTSKNIMWLATVNIEEEEGSVHAKEKGGEERRIEDWTRGNTELVIFRFPSIFSMPITRPLPPSSSFSFCTHIVKLVM